MRIMIVHVSATLFCRELQTETVLGDQNQISIFHGTDTNTDLTSSMFQCFDNVDLQREVRQACTVYYKILFNNSQKVAQ